MENFTKTAENLFSGPGIQIKQVCFKLKWTIKIRYRRAYLRSRNYMIRKTDLSLALTNFRRTFYWCTLPSMSITDFWCFAFLKVMLLNQLVLKIQNMWQNYYFIPSDFQILIREHLSLFWQTPDKYPYTMKTVWVLPVRRKH